MTQPLGASPDQPPGLPARRRRLPPHQPKRALVVVGIYLLATAAVSALAVLRAGPSLGAFLGVGWALLTAVAVAVLAPSPAGEPASFPDLPVLQRPSRH